jgi:hypothetical protein
MRAAEPDGGSVLGHVVGIIGCAGCGCATVLFFLLLVAVVCALLA